MELYVDQDLCIVCGACISLCPEVYDWNDDGKANVIVKTFPLMRKSLRKMQWIAVLQSKLKRNSRKALPIKVGPILFL